MATLPATPNEPRFSYLQSMRLGTFHIGSSFADILGSSIWNYVMANGMMALGGFVATPVTLLLAMRQLLVPLTIFTGHLSDTHPIWGYHRLPYIWIGRGLMLISLPLLPLATTLILGGNSLGWALAFLAFVMYGIGTQTSGSPFIALVRDSAPKAKQGLAYAIVQTMLVAAFAFSPLIYARLAQTFLPNYENNRSSLAQYNLDLFWLATTVALGISLIAWIVSVVGIEKPNRTLAAAQQASSATATNNAANNLAQFKSVLKSILGDRRMRSFFMLLAIGAMSGFGQDGVLEPSLREVFGYSFSQSAITTGFWGIGLLVGLIGCIGLTRKWATVEQTKIALLGLILSSFGMAWMAFATFSQNESIVIPSVTAFGLGFGIYTAGASPLLMVMALDNRAGVYLGLWSMAQLLARGVGIALGGIIYDLTRVAGLAPNAAYGIVFTLEAIGFLVCIYFLQASDVHSFAREANVPATAAIEAID